VTRLLTASFPNQGRAAAAVEKLLAHGLPRAQIRIRTDESVGNSAASSDTPTTVVSDISDAGKREDPARGTLSTRIGRHALHSRSPLEETSPAELGRATVFVAIGGELSDDDVRDVLTSAGAFSIEAGDAELPEENPGLSPVNDMGDPDDVRKAIAAARAGDPDAHAREK
jgi:hypothetical protein